MTQQATGSPPSTNIFTAQCPKCTKLTQFTRAKVIAGQGVSICPHCKSFFKAVPMENAIPKAITQQRGKLGRLFDLYAERITPGFADKKNRGLNKILIWKRWLILVCLASALVLQAAWFNRDAVCVKWPHFSRGFITICNYFNCSFFRKKNLSHIKVAHHDIREHHQIENALAVNVIVENTASFYQAQPDILLTFFDVDGIPVAWRILSPMDYLPLSSMCPGGLMPPYSSVHFSLNVTKPSGDAVGFEFSAL